MKFFYAIFLILFTLPVFAQVTVDDFSNQPTQKLLEIYGTLADDFNKKEKLSEELLTRNDLDEKNRIRLLISQGTFQMNRLEVDSALKTFQKAEVIAANSTDKDSQIRLMFICLKLAGANYVKGDYENWEKYMLKVKELDLALPETPQKIQYRQDYNTFYYYKGDFEKYYTETLKNLEKTIEAKKSNKNQNLEDIYLITEISYRVNLMNVAILQNEPKRIEENYSAVRKLMNDHAEALGKFKNFINGEIALLLSKYYSYKKDYAMAQEYISSAESTAKANHDSSLYFTSAVEDAKTAFLKGDYERSFAAAKDGIENKTFTLDFFDYEMEAYRYAALSAEKLGLNKEANFYKSLYLSKDNLLNNQFKRELLSKVLTKNEIIEATTEKTQKNKFLSRLLIAGIICLVFSIIFIFYNRYKSRQKIKRFQEIIAQLKENRNINESNADPVSKSPIMVTEKVKQILNGLEDFEKDNLFLHKETSLSSVAAHVNTNTVTLSGIINQYKKQNFNDYINGLRVDYLIEKFESDHLFRNYKLSHIAELSGYSSHSQLTKSFKKKTGMTPSEFLKLLTERMVSNN